MMADETRITLAVRGELASLALKEGALGLRRLIG